MVQAWYQGGISILDFTNPARPFEVAYFDRGPADADKRVLGGQWSTYWYNGYIYGAEIARGIDVFKLVPTQFLTQNEIDAANQVHFDELNVQNQPQIKWPANAIVARAYLDQLERSAALPAPRLAALHAALNNAAPGRALAAELVRDAATAQSPADAQRMKALAAIFSTLAANPPGAVRR